MNSPQSPGVPGFSDTGNSIGGGGGLGITTHPILTSPEFEAPPPNRTMKSNVFKESGFVKGLSTEYAPSIVISSLASLTVDNDYNYTAGYQPSNYCSKGLKPPKPMTDKDRARHGMLRVMLRKSLEITRPNWPKHPTMQSTDRVLDEEDRIKRILRKSQRGGGGGGMMRNSSGFLTTNVNQSLSPNSIFDNKPLKASPQMKRRYAPAPITDNVNDGNGNELFMQGSFNGSFEGSYSGYDNDSNSIITMGSTSSLSNLSATKNGKVYNPSPSETNLIKLKTAERTHNMGLSILANRASVVIKRERDAEIRREKGGYGGTKTARKSPKRTVGVKNDGPEVFNRGPVML